MEKSPVFFKARASGLTRALKLITRAFPGFADPIDFTNFTNLSVQMPRRTNIKDKSYFILWWLIACI